MADEKGRGQVAAALAHIGNAVARNPLSYLVGLALIFAAIHWDGHLRDQKGCFQLQELQGKAFKVDTCAGKVESLDQGTGSEQAAGAKPGAAVPPLGAEPQPDIK